MDLDVRTIPADNLARVGEKQRQADTDNHDNDESDVGARLDLALVVLQVETERDERAENTANVEETPKDGNVFALVLFLGVRHHDSALRRPQETYAAAENGAGCNDIATDLLGVIDPQGRRIDSVAPGTDL